MIKELRIFFYNLRKDVASIFQRCGFSRGDILNSGDYDEYWRKRSGHHLGLLSEWQKERAEMILPYIRHSRSSIADIGCGDGAVLAFIRNARKLNDDVLGLDSSPMALEFARRLHVKTQLFDLQADSELKNVFTADYLLFFEVLEHMSQAERILVFAIQKAERGVFFSVPNTGYFRHRFRLLFGRFPVQWIRMPNEHVRFWTLVDMRNWLACLGLDGAKVMTYQGVPFLKTIWPSMFAAGILVYIPK